MNSEPDSDSDPGSGQSTDLSSKNKALIKALILALKQALILMILNSALNPVLILMILQQVCAWKLSGRLFAWFAHMRFKLQKRRPPHRRFYPIRRSPDLYIYKRVGNYFSVLGIDSYPAGFNYAASVLRKFAIIS